MTLSPSRTDLRRLLAILALCAGAGPPVTACASTPAPPPPQEIPVACVHTVTMLRVDDMYCPDWYDDDDDDGFVPYFFPAGYYVMPVGYQVSGGHRTKPAGKIVIYKAPKQGGTGKVYIVPNKAPKPPVVKPPAPPPAPARTTSTSGGGFRRFK